jgi:hypothetical protein
VHDVCDLDIDYLDFGRVPKIELPSADEAFDVTGEIEAQNIQLPDPP